ncbi:MAG TPA: polyphenol oxidase family protein, partial [Actinomycetota bacterium]|nr:polyphenol oxidase family protein [Actinomycetota bacterium]
GDRPSNVRHNRRRVADALGIPPFATSRQPHGSRVSGVGGGRAGAGFHRPWRALRRPDALATTRPRTPVAVLAADCVPLVLASKREGRLVAVHAGWRGLAAGILARAVRRFSRPADVRAAIGPAIGPCHYEIDVPVAQAVEAGTGRAMTEQRRDGLFLDLPATTEAALRASGVDVVERSLDCTACQPDRFFSHRRDGSTGRQALIAMRL